MSDKVFWKFTEEDLSIIDDYIQIQAEKGVKDVTRDIIIKQWLDAWCMNMVGLLKNPSIKKKDYEKFKIVYDKKAPSGKGIFALILSPYHKSILEEFFKFTNMTLTKAKKDNLPTMSKMIQDLMHDQLLTLEQFVVGEKLKKETEKTTIEELDKESKIEEVK